MNRDLHRRSLHIRLAGWMIVSTLVTMAVFAAAMYAAFSLEEADEPPGPESQEEPLAAEAMHEMWMAMLIAAPVALLATTGGALFLSRRALAPLTQIIDAAHRVTASDLKERLLLPTSRDELYELTLEMNALFERLEGGFSALGRYASNASHELRTPLAVVLNQLEVTSRHPRTAVDWEQAVARVLPELRRLSQLVDALLSLARADGPLDRQISFDLRQQVDFVLASAAEQARKSGVVLSLAAEGGSEPVNILGDPDAIQSAVRNLLENALKYTPAGGKIGVAVQATASGVEVVVDDTGAGVADSEREQIFVPLWRGKPAAADAAPGHGLGLAIVKRVVERHGGSVAVTSNPEGGARFTVQFSRV